jgi:hypothetical protein
MTSALDLDRPNGVLFIISFAREEAKRESPPANKCVMPAMHARRPSAPAN